MASSVQTGSASTEDQIPYFYTYKDTHGKCFDRHTYNFSDPLSGLCDDWKNPLAKYEDAKLPKIANTRYFLPDTLKVNAGISADAQTCPASALNNIRDYPGFGSNGFQGTFEHWWDNPNKKFHYVGAYEFEGLYHQGGRPVGLDKACSPVFAQSRDFTTKVPVNKHGFGIVSGEQDYQYDYPPICGVMMNPIRSVTDKAQDIFKIYYQCQITYTRVWEYKSIWDTHSNIDPHEYSVALLQEVVDEGFKAGAYHSSGAAALEHRKDHWYRPDSHPKNQIQYSKQTAGENSHKAKFK